MCYRPQKTIALECLGDQTTKIFKLQGNGVFTLPPGCAAIGDRYIIPAHLTRSEGTLYNITLDDMKHFEINLDMQTLLTRLPKEARIDQVELLRLIEELPEDRDVKVKLNELKSQVKNWKIEGESDSYWSDTANWGVHLSLSTVGSHRNDSGHRHTVVQPQEATASYCNRKAAIRGSRGETWPDTN